MDVGSARGNYITYRDLTIGEKLGEGGFGVVYAATWQGTAIAVKELFLTNPTEQTFDDFKREEAVMERLRHPNVVTLYGYCQEPGHLCLVMERVARGSLFQVLHSSQLTDHQTCYHIALGMSAGLTYLHQQKIIHRDMKSLNVLLDREFTAKITDFGLAEVKQETQTTTQKNPIVGTTPWMAPETLDFPPKYSPASDVYALGIIFWEMMAREIPYKGVANTQIIISAVQQGKRPEMPSQIDGRFSTLIQNCWAQEPEARPAAAAIVKKLQTFCQPASESSTAVIAAAASTPPPPPSTTPVSVPSASITLSQPFTVYGAAIWKKLFDCDVEEPPLTSLATEILNSTSPFAKGNVASHQRLVLIPATLMGQPYSLNLVEQLHKGRKDKLMVGMHIRTYPQNMRIEYGALSPSRSYWILITDNMIPGSITKNYTDQLQLLNNTNYSVPKSLEMVTTAMLECMLQGGKRLYGNDSWTHSRVQELMFDHHAFCGGFSPAGIEVGVCHNDGTGRRNSGLVAVWNLSETDFGSLTQTPATPIPSLPKTTTPITYSVTSTAPAHSAATTTPITYSVTSTAPAHSAATASHTPKPVSTKPFPTKPQTAAPSVHTVHKPAPGSSKPFPTQPRKK